MRKVGKKFAAAKKQIEQKPHTIEDAIPLVQKVKYAKFDETVDVSLRLGVDPKHADQMVRGTVVLPHGLGKTKRVLAIAGGEKQVLGPRGLMPNPKTGTVTFDIAKAVKEIKAGKVEFRVDKSGIIHAPVGKTSFPAQNLIDNAHALVDSIVKAKPPAAKGKYLRSITVSSTMGPGIRIDTTQVEAAAKH
jgi:large subunit ribosomal protein L1